MLSLVYMPSDYHPVLLALGEHGDLARLSDCLAAFAGNPAELDLTAELTGRAGGACVILRPVSEDAGLAQEAPGADRLIWALTPHTAMAFADEVARLVADPALAGSTVLEIGVLDEIKVKVSHGEWEDPAIRAPKGAA
ncbi:MAG: hypothetical protein JJU40_15025 [Rhodobacteraceae bacterium]|nr:hypothetical protein [Paracoccaceae bacterium]